MLGILRNQCAVKAETITDRTRLQEDLGLDSLGLLTLAVEIENFYQIDLKENPSHPPQTVGELASLVNKRLAQDRP